MAKIIKVDGTTTNLDNNPTLMEAHRLVGGWIKGNQCWITEDNQQVRYFVVMNEKGKAKGFPKNKVVSKMVGFATYGDIILMEGNFEGEE